MDKKENPRVRWLDIVPTVDEGKEVFVVRDPEGITDKSLVVSKDILCLLSLMDGSRDVRDIQGEFLRRWGVLVQSERIESVVSAMNEQFFLLNERYESYVAHLKMTYAGRPFRDAYLSGRSYPDDRSDLRELMGRIIGQPHDDPASVDSIKGLVVPHIDYQRGVEVYTPIYRYLPTQQNTLFVIFGTCHKWAPKMWNIASRDLLTPLGLVKTPEGIGRQIAEDRFLKNYIDEWPHRNEHSIELQIPLIQFLMGERSFEVLSILTGSLHEYVNDGKNVDEGETRELIERLKALLAYHSGPCVVMAAADLAHIGAQFGDQMPLDNNVMEESKTKDRELLEAIIAADAGKFFAMVKSEEDRRRICGLAPIYFTLSMLPQCAGELIEYRQWTDGASSVSFAGAIFR
jgi:MEMO1 family protein